MEAAEADDAAGRRVPRAGDLLIRIVELDFVDAVVLRARRGSSAAGAGVRVANERGRETAPHVDRRLHFTDAAVRVARLRAVAEPAHSVAAIECEPAEDARLGDQREVRLDPAADGHGALENGILDPVVVGRSMTGDAV